MDDSTSQVVHFELVQCSVHVDFFSTFLEFFFFFLTCNACIFIAVVMFFFNLTISYSKAGTTIEDVIIYIF